MENIKTNAAGFVVFENRRFDMRGDKGTWAKVDGKKVTVCKSRHGLMSKEFIDEIYDFCQSVGIDWNEMNSGDRVTVEIA